MSSYITVNTDVDIYLDEIDTDDLVEELETRGISFNNRYADGNTMQNILSEIFELKRTGKDFTRQLDELIYQGLGRIA